MSHFFTLVIPRSKSVEELLQPYDEELEVEEYDRPCYCVGRKARNEVYGQVDAELGDMKTVQQEFWQRHPDGDDKSWNEEVRLPREKRERELMLARKDSGSPDPECDTCKGSGTYRSTYNPKSKWDWWVEGGRWSHVVNGDRAKVSYFADHIPFAIVTPDGEWHGKGDMGWWGIVSDEQYDWPTTANNLISQYAEDIGVVCDLHI